MTKKSRRILHKGIDVVAPMPDNEEAASTSGPPVPQTETGIILRARSSGILTDRVRNPGGGGGGWAREAGGGGGVFRVLACGSGGKGLGSGVGEGLVQAGRLGRSCMRGRGLGSGVGEGLYQGVHGVRACAVMRFCLMRRRGARGGADRGCLRRSAGGRSALPPVFIGRAVQQLLAPGRFSGALFASAPGGGRLPGGGGPGRGGQ